MGKVNIGCGFMVLRRSRKRAIHTERDEKEKDENKSSSSCPDELKAKLERKKNKEVVEPSDKILTAEGWKRLMMKKYRQP